MASKTRGELEAEFSKAIVKMEKEYLGRGPNDIRTFLVDDMILVRLRGILTPAEIKLAETPEGRELVKRTRQQLFESSRDFIAAMVSDIVGGQLITMHTDMSACSNERVIVLTVDVDFNKRL
jgi:uncharacterized protein YbcI